MLYTSITSDFRTVTPLLISDFEPYLHCRFYRGYYNFKFFSRCKYSTENTLIIHIRELPRINITSIVEFITIVKIT